MTWNSHSDHSDHSIFDPSQNQAVTFPEGKDEGHHSNMTLGASWLDSFTLLEQGLNGLLSQEEPLQRHLIRKRKSRLHDRRQLRCAGNRQRAESVPERKLPPKIQHQRFRALVDTLHRRTERESVPSRGPEFLDFEPPLEHRPVGRDR